MTMHAVLIFDRVAFNLTCVVHVEASGSFLLDDASIWKLTEAFSPTASYPAQKEYMSL